MAASIAPKTGILCIPFSNGSRAAEEAERLAMLHEWLIAAALEAGIKLQTVQGSYDSYRQIADRIYADLTAADLVVAAVREANPNVFFETGFAHGIGKPVLYVVRDGERVPFDIAGVEQFRYAEINDKTRSNLANVMRGCLTTGVLSQPMAVILPRLRTHLSTLRVTDNLYGRLLRHALDTTADVITSWGDNLEIVGSEAVLDMGTFIMSQIKTEGFATSYHSGRASWQQAKVSAASPDYFEATRKAVERDVKITRVYVIDNLLELDDPTLRKQVWADASAGLDVRYMLRKHLPDDRAIDFGLWDNALVAEIHYAAESDGSLRLHRCHYWGDRLRLRRAREWRKAIEREALPCPDLPGERGLLEESAEMFLGESCETSGSHRPDCSPYHTSWQQLRLCDVVSTPRWHAEFYTECFRRWSVANEMTDDAHAANGKGDGREPLNVLITGLADYGMLYWILQSISPTVRKRCVFHVLDLCQTPLNSCRWLQRRLTQCDPPLNVEVEVYRRDIFDNRLAKKSYDLIASDAFLTRFEQMDVKRRLMTEWIGLLRSDGMLVTTARVRERSEDITAADREQFVQRVMEVVHARRLAIDFTPIVGRYAEYIESYPFESEKALKVFVRSTVGEKMSSSVEFSLIEDWEMTRANYGRIVVNGGGQGQGPIEVASEALMRDH